MFRQDLAQPFGRIMGCTPTELSSWLPRALPGVHLEIESTPESGWCLAAFDDGQLLIEWRVMEPRRIALLRVPQLNVRFTYSGLEDVRRREVQIYFDRATQRGGG